MKIALLLTLAALVLGQETVPFNSGMVIRATTNLVQVRVVAEDSQGNPVTGLQRADFQIQDNRKPQPITFFTADRTKRAAPSSSPNQPADSGEMTGSYSVILLDWLNTQYAYRLQAQEMLLDLLKKYQPRQKVAIYLLGHDPRLLHDFTDDMDILHQMVENAGLEFGLVEDNPAKPGRFDARNPPAGGRAGDAEIEALMMQNKVFDTLHTLQLVADHLLHVPGRKSLIWVTAGFPQTAGGIDFAPRTETALNRLNQSDVATYVVNPCGLSSQCRSYPGPMTEISQRTGGTVFGDNDTDRGIRLALEDMSLAYTLGFNVPDGAALGPHEIRVRANRPGVRLRYRESYDWAGK